MKLVRGFIIFFCLIAVAPAYAEDFMQVPAAIQIASSISDGEYPPEDIVRICRQKGMRAVLLADRDFMKWEYGIWPLRSVIKRTVSAASIASYGFRRYFERLQRLQQANPDMAIVAGAESSPFYFWQGWPFNGTLELKNWHQHVLVFGLEHPGDYEQLPVTGNRSAHPGFDQYHGDRGTVPYQRYFDYVAGRNGLAFWAHPEVKNTAHEGAISIRTDDRSDYLLRTTGYTGFVYSREGQNKIGSIAGIWDEVLMQYCRRQRRKPVWAISGLAFDRGRLEDALGNQRTMLLVRWLNQQQVLESLEKGRMYVLQGNASGDFLLEHFTVTDIATGAVARMGQEVSCAGKAQIRIAGNYLRGQSGPFTIKLIRNGKLFRVLEGPSQFDLSVTDEDLPREFKTYYRVQIEGAGILVISNPVFVVRNERV